MRKAFTLIELLVVIAIIAILVTILVPVVMTALGKSETTICQNNLGVMGRKYNDYANDSDNADRPFARHSTDNTADPKVDFFANPNLVDTGVANAAGFVAIGGSTLDNLLASGIGLCGMQTVWVLIGDGFLPDSAFKCPGDSGYEPRSGPTLLKYGWTSLLQFSYGIHYPYDGRIALGDNPADPMDKDGKGRFVYRENMPLFADRNPNGGVDGTNRLHSNHGGNDGGMLVVSRIGNTTFHKPVENPPGTFTPDSVLAGDDIYNSQAEAIGAAAVVNSPPVNSNDTIITPVDSKGSRD